MFDLRPKHKIFAFFEKMGNSLEPEIMEAIFNEASADGENSSIQDFRDVLNDYLEACDTGYEEHWRRQRNLI